MHISDWSSDVCSSDLCCMPGSYTLSTQQNNPYNLNSYRRARPSTGVRAVHCPGYPDAAITQTNMVFQRPDRKSVVWGKSVSVRVDLGGRRIIKKKKKT